MQRLLYYVAGREHTDDKYIQSRLGPEGSHQRSLQHPHPPTQTDRSRQNRRRQQTALPTGNQGILKPLKCFPSENFRFPRTIAQISLTS